MGDGKRKNKVLIPKLIHVVWIGPLPFPYQDNLKTWEQYNPGWRLRFWTNDDLPEIFKWLHNKDVYDLIPYWSGKVNVLRYELLYRFGGLYSDADSYCLRPLDLLLAGLECFGMTGNRGRVCAATLGCVPGHPAFEKIAFGLRDHLNKIRKKQKRKGKACKLHEITGTGYISPILMKWPGFVQLDGRVKRGSRKYVCVRDELCEETYICQLHDGSWKDELKKGRYKV